MSEPFLGQIMLVGFNFPPRGWATCDGQLLPINQYQSLFSLLGTNFGGDGRTTFALPDLRGRTPVEIGANGVNSLGQRGGEESHTLTANEIPAHTHAVSATDTRASTDHVEGAAPATADVPRYTTGAPNTNLSSASVSNAPGSGVPHNNMQPYLAVYFCIALQGTFPSRN